MKQSEFKADEMEISINFKSLKIAYVFTELCLMAYCLYHIFALGDFPIVAAIWLAGVAAFFVAKLIYTQRITRTGENEE